MWTKVILSVVLVAFVGVQFANSLSCYSCKNPTSCLNPATESCSNATANVNQAWLATYHSNVPAINGSQSFYCANLTYFYASKFCLDPNSLRDLQFKNTLFPADNSHSSEFLGCVHPATNVCNLTLTGATSWSKKCKTCNTDYCNPAGTFSGSAYTILGSVIAVLLAKVLS
ncbi:hypothetical protein KR018_000115 [Drosophila ironensis]|nr:hypothetical protein KR018_000115 [Drosophila ironensis]